MKQFIVRTLLVLGLAFSISNGYAQTNIANCPKKGTADCPLVKMESGATYAAKTTMANKKTDADLPSCCRKETN